jgi:Na+/melibiose symporter-like transporter
MRLSVAEGGLATAMSALFSGVFLTGFALAMGASRLQIGILAALPSLCSVAQLFGSYLIERWGNSKRLCVAACLVSRLTYLPVLLVPLLTPGLERETQVWWVVGLMAVSGLLSSLAGVAWLSWTKALVPGHLRIPFFGRRNLVNTGLSFAVCLVAGAAIDWQSGNGESPILAFVAVFALAMLCGMVGLAILARIPSADAPRTESARPPFARMLAAPLREANFRRVMSFYVVWNFAVHTAAPFVPVYFLQKLGLPFWYIIVLSTISSLSGMAANGLWTRLAQRFGLKPVVFLATLADAFFPLSLVFVEAQWTWVLFFIYLSGALNTPLVTGPDNFILKLAPDLNASSYMAVFKAIVGLSVAAAAVTGGWIAGAFASVPVSVGEMALGGLKIVFVLSFIGRMASLILLAGVREPEAQTLRYVVRVFRRWRRWRAPLSADAPQPATVVPRPHFAPAAIASRTVETVPIETAG